MLPKIYLFVLIAFSTTHSLAGGGHQGRRSMPFELLETLDLSSGQKEMIANLRQQSLSEDGFREKRKAKKAFYDAVKDPKKGEIELRKLHEKVVEAKVASMQKRFQRMMAIRKILTPAQLIKFHEAMEERKGKRKHRKQRHDHKHDK